MVRLTEMEKTILLAFLILTRGKEVYVREDEVVLKFVPRQRKMVRSYIKKLGKHKLISKHPTQKSYRLTEAGKRRAVRLLAEGVTLPPKTEL